VIVASAVGLQAASNRLPTVIQTPSTTGGTVLTTAFPVVPSGGTPVGGVVGLLRVAADPRQLASALQMQRLTIPAAAANQQPNQQTPVYIAGPPMSVSPTGVNSQPRSHIVMSPLSPQQLALLSSSIAPSSQQQQQLANMLAAAASSGPRQLTLVTAATGPQLRPQLMQQCLLTQGPGPQQLALIPASGQSQQQVTTQLTSASVTQTPTTPQAVPQLAILPPTINTITSSSMQGQPVTLISAAPNQQQVAHFPC
jgi:hypothetical protein